MDHLAYPINLNKKRVLILTNPKAGVRSGRPAVDSLAELLQQQGLQVNIITDIQELETESHRASEAGELRAVVSAGGDGTISLVVNHTPPRTPLAVLPLGTENLLSKFLEISPTPESVAELVTQGGVVALDAASANNRIFLLMAGCGFDADVVQRLHKNRTGHIHHLSYAKPILDSIRNYEYPEVKIQYENEESKGEIRAKWVFVVNVPRYAGGLEIAPNASGFDGLLDICTFKEGSFWNGIRYLSGVVLGQHESFQDFITVKAKRIRLESDGEVPFQLDGDPGGYLPVDIEVLPGRLHTIVPRQWLEQQGVPLTEPVS